MPVKGIVSVMLARYKPDNGSCAVATADLTTMLTASYLSEVTSSGLFVWSFMDDGIVRCSRQLDSFVKSAIATYRTVGQVTGPNRTRV